MFPLPKEGPVSPYGQVSGGVLAEPSELLVGFSHLLPAEGHALDIACGKGRNTLFLAWRGLIATGVDCSREALGAGREMATRSGLTAHFVQADLTRFSLPDSIFSVILCFKYRDPALYSSIRGALRTGGLLIYETHTAEHLRFGRKPGTPAHLLGRNELLHAFADWEIIYYHEVWIGRGTASLVARKPFFC